MKKFFIGIAVVIIAIVVSFTTFACVNENETAQAETPTIEDVVELYVLEEFGEGYYGVARPDIFEGDNLIALITYDAEGEPYAYGAINVRYYTNKYFS